MTVSLVKYNFSGAAQWAKSTSSGTGIYRFYSVAVGSGAIYTAGNQVAAGTVGYGDGVTAKGTASDHNVILVKYKK
jgi:hypothetical protein